MADPIGTEPRPLELHREVVAAIGRAMVAKLDANAHKRNWRELEFDYLVLRLREEVKELNDAIEDGIPSDIRAESVDVANMCTMIFDVLQPPVAAEPAFEVIGDPAPYRVEPDEPACEACGQTHGFCVIGPDGVAMATTFHERDDAEQLADDMNSAYEAGQHAALAADPILRFLANKAAVAVGRGQASFEANGLIHFADGDTAELACAAALVMLGKGGA